MESPLISKMTFSSPNDKKTAHNLKAYLNYIATRDGVDLTKLDEHSNNYALFGNIECSDIDKTASFIQNLSNGNYDGCRHNIFKCVVSLKESDAVRLGFDEKRAWLELMKVSMPKIAVIYKIPIENLQWVAAVHMEKGHPHCHYLFWSSKNLARTPFISTPMQHASREVFAQEVFKLEREQLIINKTAARDSILEFGKELMHTINDMPIAKLPGRFKADEIKDLRNMLINLINELPQKGRMLYAFMPLETKKEIDQISEYLFQMPAIKYVYQQYNNLNTEILKSYSASDGKTTVKVEDAEADIKRRIGNQVIKCAVEMREHNNIAALEEDDTNEEITIPIDDNYMTPESNDFYLSSEEINSIYDNPPFYDADFEPVKNDTDTVSYMAPESDDFYLSSEEINSIFDHPPLYDTDSEAIENDTLSKESLYKLSWSADYKSAQSLIKSDGINDHIEDILALLKKEADKGNVLAYYDLGKLYSGKLKHMQDAKSLSESYYENALEGFLSINSTKNSKLFSFTNFNIGKMYAHGLGTQTDINKAAEYLNREIDNGNIYAKNILAKIYLTNKDNSNIEKGIQLLNEIFENEKSNAHLKKQTAYTLGKYYLHDKDSQEKAIEFLQYSSNAENHWSTFLLAKTYLDNNSHFYNIEKSIELLKKLAEAGNSKLKALSTFELAKIYLTKNSEKYNQDEGIKLCKEILENSESESESKLCSAVSYTLGKHYHSNVGNKENSLYWLNFSSTRGNNWATFLLAKIYAAKDSKNYDIEKSLTLLKELINSDNDNLRVASTYQFAVANLKANKIEEAINYFEKSSQCNNSYADYHLGNIYSSKESSFYNAEKALFFYKKSAEQGNEYGEYKYGKALCSNGDIDKGLQYLNLSSSKGNASATVEIGSIYLFGKYGIAKNIEHGLSILNSEKEKGNEYAIETLEFYQKCKSAAETSAVYSLCRSVFNTLNHDLQEKRYHHFSNKMFRIHSKESKKTMAKRQEREQDY
jgi:TPR repeat protein